MLYRVRSNDRLYEIRAAGSTRRLYTDGVLHSQFNPRRVVTGSVWDLLWLGLFFRPNPAPQRVLLLGLGAGTVVRQLQSLFGDLSITAVENDDVHIRLAREHFGIDGARADIHHQDAREFVARYRGPKFDLVIDDLFSGSGGTPSRALPFSVPWFSQLKRCLADDGILSANFADTRELNASAVQGALTRGSRFRSGFGFRGPTTENVIATLLPFHAQSADLRAQLAVTPVLSKALANDQLRYLVRTLR